MHVDYMSSENTASGGEENEEDEDDGQKIVTVHKLPWCSKKVTELFSNLDARTKVNGWKTGRVSKKVFDNIQTLWHCNYNNKGNIEATARKLRLPFYIMPAPMRNLGMIIVQRAPTAGNDDGVLGHAAFRSSWLYSNKGLSPTETSEYTTANTNGIKTPENVNVGGVANLDKQLKSISELSREFALRTTSHGVARIAESTNRCSKLLWISVVFIAFGAFTGQLIALIITFLEYPVIINIDVVSRNTLPFPAVTICNTNKVRKSAVLESRYNALLDIDDFRERRAYLTYMGPCIPGDVPCDVDENQCVKSYMKCNGINDCPNGGDEAVCNYGECFEGEFQCPNGKCIPASSQCDYRNDCEDNTDEEDCSFPSCADNEFTCTNHQCMSVSLVCDGNADCYDGSDELIGEHCLYPGSVCSPDFFRCTNGECIHYTLRCDQYADCSDSSDESECQHNKCPDAYFTCLSGQCIPLTDRCDYNLECNDGSDEINCTKAECPNGYFQCRSGQCVDLSKRCDSVADCTDAMDEFNCTGLEPPPIICEDNQFKCISVEKCINSSQVCNRVDNCGDKSDEVACMYTVECNMNEFKCDNDIDDFCIPRTWLCDRINQCGDGSDENECTYDVANVFSDSDWKAKYSDITNREDIYREFTQNVYSARNFDFIPSEDPPSWDHFLLASSTPDFTDLQDVLKLSSPELSIMGHQIDDFILQCTYDKKKCNLSEFYEFQHDKYGNCFTFNHGFDTKIRQATKSGADYGLKLTLFTEQNEYISLFGQQSGVRVVIHNPSTKPFPEDEGVYVKPGAVTAVSIKQNEWTRKGPPFGNCSTHFPESDVKYNYSSLACQKQCLQDYLFSKCGCVDTLSDDKPRCSVLNKTQDACKQLMNYFYREAMLSCDCQLPCREFSFSKTISQALWPSTTYLPHLLNSIHATNRKTWVIRDKESAREDLVRLEVYFEDLNIQLVSEEEAYPVSQLLSDTGGSLGLWVGLSFITVIEFTEFLFAMCSTTRARHSHNRIMRKSVRRSGANPVTSP
ncbi:uncharacterized protein LOC102805083 [Saccoglossus kowalevskii]